MRQMGSAMSQPTRPPEPANRHRPRDRETLRCAAVELRSRGLTPQDIAQALGLSTAAVEQLIGPAMRATGGQ